MSGVNLSAIHPNLRAINALKINGINISDVSIANGQVYVYSSVTGKFEPVNLEGKILTSSNAAPSGGIDGSHHLNFITGDIYKKISGNWSVIYTVGSGGGSTILFSSGIPSSGAGSLNDYCIDTVNNKLYKKELVESVATWVLKYTFASGGSTANFLTDALLYGTNGNYDNDLVDYRCKWTSNILSVQHSLNELNPNVIVHFLNTVSSLYNSCNVPFEIIDANNINFDFSGCTGLTFIIKISK